MHAKNTVSLLIDSFEKGQLSGIDTIDDFEEEPIKEGEESKIEGKIDPAARSSHPVSHSEWI
jgi:hypothetical protein